LVPPKGSPVDVIFLDPPYHLPHLVHGSLKKLHKYNWINENTIIIIETSRHTKLKSVEHLPLKLLRTKIISRSLIQFFQLDQSN
jgi:16S rRNA G966 N2-methylase RsmD